MRETPINESLGRLIVEVFRLNGRLLAGADSLVAGLGLSSARWQVLWSIDMACAPQTVAQLARAIGLTRQAVQRVVNELVAEDLLAMLENPGDLRAKLVAMTPAGQGVYDAANALRRPWIEGLGQGLDRGDLDVATRLLAALRQRLE